MSKSHSKSQNQNQSNSKRTRRIIIRSRIESSQAALASASAQPNGSSSTKPNTNAEIQTAETVSKYADLEHIQKDGMSIILDEQVCLVADIISDERIFLLECVVHLCDIANPAPNIDIARKWTKRVINEWFLQVEFLYFFDFFNLFFFFSFGARIFQMFANAFCCVLKETCC